jgi:hypothetical protein
MKKNHTITHTLKFKNTLKFNTSMFYISKKNSKTRPPLYALYNIPVQHWFGLWAWPLEASHYRCPSREAMGIHGQRFGCWAWSLEASHYARPKAPIPIFYWLFLAHFFGLSTKFGHSIPRPLDLDGHNVKQPLI